MTIALLAAGFGWIELSWTRSLTGHWLPARERYRRAASLPGVRIGHKVGTIAIGVAGTTMMKTTIGAGFSAGSSTLTDVWAEG